MSRFYARAGKRLLDLLLTVPGLILLSPVILLLAWMIRIKLGSPVLFRQQRPGLQGAPFTLLKFRTMTDARDHANQLLPDAERLTPFGRFLRSASLDEIPELLNVLRGEMSLVGPRPLLMKYLPYYRAEEQSRHSLRPGITGLAQVKGRNLLSWDDRLALDCVYVAKCSFLFDVKILLLTLLQIFKRDGVIVDPRSRMLDLDDERRAPQTGNVNHPFG